MAANLVMTISKSKPDTNINEDEPIKHYLDDELLDYQSSEDVFHNISQDISQDTSSNYSRNTSPNESQNTPPDSFQDNDIDVENIEDDTLTSSIESLNERLERTLPKDIEQSDYVDKPPPYMPPLSSVPIPNVPPVKKVTFDNNIQTKIIENCKDKKPQNVTLKLADLQLVLNIIQVCYNRQAFKINEMETIGLIYNKLKIFITQATQQSNT